MESRGERNIAAAVSVHTLTRPPYDQATALPGNETDELDEANGDVQETDGVVLDTSVLEAAQSPTASAPAGYGHKTIGFLSGVCLLYNNITGPGMVQLQLIYAEAGWLWAFVFLVAPAILTLVAAMLLIEAMARQPQNGKFQRRMELMHVCRRVLPNWGYLAILFGFVFNLLACNVSAYIISSQATDEALHAAFGRLCALELYPSPLTWACIQIDGITDSPFGNRWVLSPGFLVVGLFCLPLGFWNLDDNMKVQIGSFLVLMVIIGVWMVEFGLQGLHLDRVPAIGSAVFVQLGAALFNYTYVVTVPSWVNEKQPGVSINKCLSYSVLFSVVTYIAIGWIGALAFGVTPGEDLLAVLSRSDTMGWTKLATYVFPWSALVSGIPITSIVVRYNLLHDGMLSPSWANFIAVVLPWGLALLLYSGSLLDKIVNYSGIVSIIPLNIIIPSLLLICTHRTFGGETISGRQTINKPPYSLLRKGSGDKDEAGGMNGIPSNNGTENGLSGDGEVVITTTVCLTAPGTWPSCSTSAPSSSSRPRQRKWKQVGGRRIPTPPLNEPTLMPASPGVTSPITTTVETKHKEQQVIASGSSSSNAADDSGVVVVRAAAIAMAEIVKEGRSMQDPTRGINADGDDQEDEDEIDGEEGEGEEHLVDEERNGGEEEDYRALPVSFRHWTLPLAYGVFGIGCLGMVLSLLTRLAT